MTDRGDASLSDALRALPTHDVDDWRREHGRLVARAALTAPPRNLWVRVLEPVALAAFGTAHVLWAFLQAAAILAP